ncbi:MAG: glycosyltransferase N-terminal domain-containing protein [Crocinitomicaceae bacterium]|nr:glycosyltransferase N-terminal domain-containing protein [Crocinitomicaceae bacterium]MDG1776521.1 glycosyltransferase N-terminal domain-containing protein [Crocinitomicaceae bacterium]
MRILSLVNPKAKKWVAGRSKIFGQLPELEKRDVIWFHCASLGEFDQGLPLMELIKSNNPNCFLLVTFFSPSGMDHYYKRQHCADHVMYLPLDTPSNAAKFIAHFNPTQAFFVKYEFWSNFIYTARKNNTSIYNISGLFRDDHRFFKWYGNFFRHTLTKFDWFFVQNQHSKELLASIGIQNVSVTGDSRFDKVIDNKKNATKDSIIETFCAGQKPLIIGSSWPEDEKHILNAIANSSKKIIIAPHNVDERHISGIIAQLTVRYSRYTKANDNHALEQSTILILDTIGQLSNAYFYGSIAYVGGGFSGSLHNILEPAVFGLPVIFGPKHKRFPEGQAFINHGFGFSINSPQEICEALETIEENYTAIQKKEFEFIAINAGASLKIYTKIFSV